MALISTALFIETNLEFQIPQVIQAAWVRGDSNSVIPTGSDIIRCVNPSYLGNMNCPDPCAQFDPCVVTNLVAAEGGFLSSILGGFGL